MVLRDAIRIPTTRRLAQGICAWVLLGWASGAQAQFQLAPLGSGPPTGGSLQIGTGLALPATAGIFFGGMTPGNAGTPFWPPLPIGPASNITPGGSTRTIMQTLGSSMGGAIVIPPAVLSFPADGTRNKVGVFPTNPVAFQVATTIDYAWPSATATFAPGSGPGPAFISGPPLGAGGVTYGGTANSFGGPGRFALVPGPAAGTYGVPANGTGMLPIATVWLNIAQGGATSVMTVGVVGASNPLGLAVQGAPLASPFSSTMFGAVPMSLRTVNVPAGGGGCTMWCVGPNGTICSSGPGMSGVGVTNMATSTEGFPWTTGLITVSQPGAVGGPEVFFLSGTDMRVAGVGNLSMVSSALGQRMLSGANSNRAWVSLNLPEPGTTAGAACALGALALCHGLARRRRSS